MKKFALTLLCLFILQVSMEAQTYDFLPKGLKPLPEGARVQISLSLPMYLENGDKLEQMAAVKHVSSPDYKMSVFVGEDNQPAAIVLVEASAEEKAAKLAQLMAMDNTGDWRGKEAPDFQVVNMDGEKINLSDLKGKVVALNFWFIGCKPCIIEMPELNELVEKYEKEGVVFVAFALDTKNRLDPFLKKKAFDYNIIPQARSVSQTYSVSGYPSHFLIDKEGKVDFFQTGYNGGLSAILDKRIGDLLNN